MTLVTLFLPTPGTPPPPPPPPPPVVASRLVNQDIFDFGTETQVAWLRISHNDDGTLRSAINVLPYPGVAGVVATDASLAPLLTLVVTDPNPITMSAPTNSRLGTRITYKVTNSSGTTMGVITWDAVFKLDVAGFVSPRDGTSKTISFVYDGHWIQDGPASGEI